VKIVIVGCGRVGGSAAELWDRAGHEVIVLDVSNRAFERLPSSFGGTAERGDGTDEDVLRRAGSEGADIFLALTEGDNRNVMAAQLAVEAFHVPRVIAKINDPVRAGAYAELGIGTICRTGLMVDAMNAHLGFPASGLAGMLAPSGQHPGGEHHDEEDASPGDASEAPAASESGPAAAGRTKEA
jgi:trk system potassium uptake protein TrkA